MASDTAAAHPQSDIPETGPAKRAVNKPKESILYPGAALMFIAVIGCFTAWGIAADLTTPMVSGFKRIFDMNAFQASLVQMAYYGAYFLLALPAAFINERWGYKAGLISGLALATAGAFLFFPAANIMTYGAFLVALFAIAAGCSILETSASPYVISLGPEKTATRRLNLAQAFNPVGTNIGVLVASTMILPTLDAPVNLAGADDAALREVRATQLRAVMGPYIALGVLLLLILVIIAFQKPPKSMVQAAEKAEDDGQTVGQKMRRLWNSKRYRYGVVAQFFNLSAQVCCWTYILQYVQQTMDGSLQLGAQLLQVSLLIFLVSRFFMTWLIGHIQATKVMTVLGTLAVAICLFAVLVPGPAGVAALVCVSFCLSLMFPTIYGVALEGLGSATKFGAAGLVMAIVGGAIMPMVQGRVMDMTSASTSFVVPALCFAVVTAYAIYDVRLTRRLNSASNSSSAGRS
ncbi:L-fucose:H+ symporter permease [Ancrocorticia populi]|uniref:L-fucose:H+ symporter permease n=1 Tax=Ancrocorticia populi TaxID=2175228 RepID=UPI003F913339